MGVASIRCHVTSALVLCAVTATHGEPIGAAFLDTGLGARALGLGGAMTAVADGPDAVFYNPAGMAASRGTGVLASYQPMSLERTRAGLAASANLRGDLAFALAWVHAGVDGLRARSGSGEVLEGSIDDAEDAVFFGIGTTLGERLQIGAGVKILDHRIDVPQTGESSASGRTVDLGLRYRLGAHTVTAVTVRNLLDKLSWTVIRPAAQTSASDESLLSAVALGVAHRYRAVLGAVDIEVLDAGGDRELRAHLGAEWRVSDLLSVRGGLHRVGDADGVGLPAFGVTVRPMRLEDLQLHYAYVGDDLDAGGRTVVAVSGRFR